MFNLLVRTEKKCEVWTLFLTGPCPICVSCKRVLRLLISLPVNSFFFSQRLQILQQLLVTLQNPSYATEGQNLTVVWIYTLDDTGGLAQFDISTDSGNGLLIGKRFSPGVITV